jgi:hypothetical protein
MGREGVGNLRHQKVQGIRAIFSSGPCCHQISSSELIIRSWNILRVNNSSSSGQSELRLKCEEKNKNTKRKRKLHALEG